MADTGKIIIDIELKGDGSVDINKLDKSLEQLNKETKNTESSVRKMIAALKEQRAEVLMTDEAYERLTTEINKYEKSLKKASTSSGQMQDKTGLAGAAVVELGRTISDSNYGFTAMANNISQLATLFTTLVVTTKGVKNAAQAMWTALKGPLGVIVVFQIVVAVLEKMAMNAKKAGEEVASLNKILTDEITILKEIKRSLDENLLSEEEKRDVIQDLNDKYKDLNITEENSIRIIDEKIKALTREARARAVVSQITELQNKLVEIELMKGKELISTYQTFWLGLKDRVRGFISGTEGIQTDTIDEWIKLSEKKTKELTSEVEKDIKKLQDILQEEGLFDDLLNTTSSGGSSKMLKDFKSVVEDYQNEIISAQRNVDKALATSRVESVNAEAEAAVTKLNIKKRQYESERIASKNNALKEVDESSLSEQEKTRRKEEINNTYQQNILASEAAFQEALWLINQEWTLKQEAAFQQDEFDKVKQNIAIAQQYADAMSSVFDFIDSEFQRQLDSQQAYANEQNNILREQLNNENLSAEERKKIQGKISDNDERARRKSDEIKKKQFKANKAFSIAEATVNTFLAATQTLKDPFLGPLRIPSAIATITFGLAQVAMIARQKFVPTASSASGGGGAGGSGGGDRVFDFNLVGESPESQLNKTIQSQFEKPLQAYVVSKDISSQQELDLNIRNAAKI